jgi:hypothetical protein
VVAAHCVEGINTVVNMDLVATTAQGLAKAVHIRSVATEAVLAKEGRDHAELQLRPPVAFDADRPPRQTFVSSRY